MHLRTTGATSELAQYTQAKLWVPHPSRFCLGGMVSPVVAVFDSIELLHCSLQLVLPPKANRKIERTIAPA
jgi:hypothetical protein